MVLTLPVKHHEEVIVLLIFFIIFILYFWRSDGVAYVGRPPPPRSIVREYSDASGQSSNQGQVRPVARAHINSGVAAQWLNRSAVHRRAFKATFSDNRKR